MENEGDNRPDDRVDPEFDKVGKPLPPASPIGSVNASEGQDRIDEEIQRNIKLASQTKFSSGNDSDFLRKVSDVRYIRQLADQQTSPTSICGYRIIRPLGSGGMGQVWLAEQDQPIKRQVAIKVVKSAMKTDSIVARFEVERQALALMNHANIAQILDAGTTDEGLPFIVMEYVSGIPLHRYCDENRLGIDDRLRLFLNICSGVQHAHQKGVIHRDLKPGNIVVVTQDGKPVPKIIDFGLAKALDDSARLTEKTHATAIGQILGTVKYMSPEQASLDSQDIDTRTDIYALGVILYELLTGTTPLDDASIKENKLLTVFELIRERVQPLPSIRLANSAEENISSITHLRRTDHSTLNRVLSGDLDWVVMKALEKERERRYESASAFAADVSRYLDNEPVLARPPSLNYRVNKFVRKNRLAVLGGLVLLVTLLSGIIGTSWGLVRANAAAADAVAARKAESKRADSEALAKQTAQEATTQAEKRLEQLEKGNEILGSIFDDIKISAIKKSGEPLEEVLVEKLVAAARQLDGDSVGDPLIVAKLQGRLASSLNSLGHPGDALPLNQAALDVFKERLGLKHDDTLLAMSGLATTFRGLGQPAEATALREQVVESVEAKLGPEDPKTIAAMNNLAVSYQLDHNPAAIPLLTRIAEIRERELGETHPDTINSWAHVGLCHHGLGDSRNALPILEKTWSRLKDRLTNGKTEDLYALDNSIKSLAVILVSRGRGNEVLPVMRESLERLEKEYGLESPSTIQFKESYANLLYGLEQDQEALQQYQELLANSRTKRGDKHVKNTKYMRDIGNLYRVLGQSDKAISMLEKTREYTEERLGAKHPDTLMMMVDLAMAYRDVDRLDEAIKLLEPAFEARALLPINPPGIAKPMLEVYVAAKRNDDAARLVKIMAAESQASMPANSPQLGGTLCGLGSTILPLEMYAEAEPLLRESLAIWNKIEPDSWITSNIKTLLGESLLGQDRLDEAEPMLVSGFEGLNKHVDDIPESEREAMLKDAANRVINLYSRQKKSDEVKRWRKIRDDLLEKLRDR